MEPLRTVWEAVLEEAARCLDEARQPGMLVRVSELMGWCVDAGVSVKYGRKVRGVPLLACRGLLRTALPWDASLPPPSHPVSQGITLPALQVP